MEPARSWWPQLGCTNLQTVAAAAVATITKVHSARRKVVECGGIPALVQLLIKGSAEAQSHAARSIGILAENRNFAYEARLSLSCFTTISHNYDEGLYKFRRFATDEACLLSH